MEEGERESKTGTERTIRKREREGECREGKVMGERQKGRRKGVRRTRATTTVRPDTINFHALHPPVNSSPRWRPMLERLPMKLIKINTREREREMRDGKRGRT